MLKKITDYLLDYIPLFLISYVLCYPLQNLIPSFVQIILFGIWIILLLIQKNDIFKAILKKGIPIYLFVLVVLIRCLVSRTITINFYSPAKLLLLLYLVFSYYSIFIYFSYSQNKITKVKICIYVALASLVISNLFSIYYMLIFDRHAMREALTSVYFGLGDFDLVYSNVLFLGVSFYYMLTSRKNFLYFTICFSFLTSVVLVFLSDFMIAIIMMFIAIFLALYFKFFKSIKKLVLLCVCCFVALYVLRTPIANFLNWFSKANVLSLYMNMKLEYIANFLLGSGDTETLGDRMHLVSISLNTFIKNPLFGISYSNYNVKTLGLHTEWFDNLGYYGVVGCAYLWSYYGIIISDFYKEMKNNNLIKVVFCTLLVMGFFNPILSGANFSVLVFAFLLCKVNSLLSEENNRSCKNLITKEKLLSETSEDKTNLSFIIPTYNRFDKLQEAIDSIYQADNKKISYEIIVLDNASDYSDSQRNQLQKMPSVKYHRNLENIGMFGNMNQAGKFANGEFLVFLHDDDKIKDNYFNVLSGIDMDSINVLIPSYSYFGSGKPPIETTSIERIISTIFIFRYLYRPKLQVLTNENVLYSRRNIYGPPSCGLIIRKQIFDESDGFNPKYHPSSDFDFFIRLSKKYKLTRINKTISGYRWEENESLSQKAQDQFAIFNLEFYEKLGERSLYYKFFRNEIRYGIVHRSLNSSYFQDNVKESFKYSKIKYILYNLIRMSYYYYNNLDL